MADGDHDSTSMGAGGGGRGIAGFECNICSKLAEDPVITLCGHLHCWPCIYKWLHEELHDYCPVCKAVVEEEKLIPLYGRGNATTPNPRPIPLEIPNRPAGQRPQTAAPPPALIGGFGVSSPVFSVRFHEFSDANGYSYGYYGSFSEGGVVDQSAAPGNHEILYRILFLVLLFVLFDFLTF